MHERTFFDLSHSVRKDDSSNIFCSMGKLRHTPVKLCLRNEELDTGLLALPVRSVHNNVNERYFIAPSEAIALLTLFKNPARDLHIDSVGAYVPLAPTAPPVCGFGRLLSSPRILFHLVRELFSPEYYMSSLPLAPASSLTRNKDFTFSE